jgi:hypothetical protein
MAELVIYDFPKPLDGAAANEEMTELFSSIVTGLFLDLRLKAVGVLDIIKEAPVVHFLT